MSNYVEAMFYNVKLGHEMVCCTCDRGQFHNITQSLKKSVLIRFIEIEEVTVHIFVIGNSTQMHTVTEITK